MKKTIGMIVALIVIATAIGVYDIWPRFVRKGCAGKIRSEKLAETRLLRIPASVRLDYELCLHERGLVR